MLTLNPRILKFLKFFPARNIDAFLVTKDVNISYLTKFVSSDAWLLVHAKRVFYITDFRYILEATKGLRGIHVVRFKSSMGQTVFELAKELKIKRLGFDDRHMSHHLYKTLKSQCPASLRFVACENIVENIRQIKENTELLLMQKAIRINKKAFEFLKKIVKPGMRECDILMSLERFVKDHHAGFSFSPIIASGPNSCLPHARVTRRKLKAHDVLLLDVGIEVQGYKSDLTRMVFLGKIPRPIQNICEIVCASQRAAISMIKPGIAAKFVDQQARNYLKNHQLNEYFGHSLGHGVGLEIHEAPSLSSMSLSTLKEGMVVTVEPAVYFPHKFGIRVEDMVLVTKNGHKVLS